jgi:PAS domain S-box-containing protein
MEKPLKILLLEDSSLDAKLIERLLKKSALQFEFRHVANKNDFLIALGEYSPDVILSDNSLPSYNATEAVQLVRSLSMHIPFILITGTVSEEFAATIMKLGADDYILKDRMARLPAAIDAALKQRRLEKEKEQAQKAILESEEKYRTLVEQAFDGILVYTIEGVILDCNLTACEYIGYPNNELKKLRVQDLFFEEDLLVKPLYFETLKAGHPTFDNRRLKRKDGSFLEMEISTKMMPDGNLMAIARDVTEKKKAAEELRTSEISLRKAQALTHISNWEVNLVSGVNTWSDEFYKIYGLNKAEVKPSPELFLSFMHPDDLPVTQKTVEESFVTHKDSSFTFRFIRKDGMTRHGYSEWRFEFDKKGVPIRLFGILQDITEKVEAEETMRLMEQEISMQKLQEQKKITRAILTAQERERNRLGQELHDNINQILASTKIYLSMASKGDVMKELIKYPMELIDNTMREIRLLSSRQVTPLKDVDLKELIQSQLDNFTGSTGIKADFVYDAGTRPMADDHKLNIYRIIQEQINNIVKYAEAKNIGICIQADEKLIHLIVTDDGKGFDVQKKRKGIGISNMMNRVESFNGEIKIDSSPGKGCKIEATIPY